LVATAQERSRNDIKRFRDRFLAPSAGCGSLAFWHNFGNRHECRPRHDRGCSPQFEREMMLERQREGIARAKAEGKYKGRKPTARAKAQDALRLSREGKKVAHIAEELGISRGSVYRALADTATT
jgi:helix-turn-helix resolvase-like protein